MLSLSAFWYAPTCVITIIIFYLLLKEPSYKLSSYAYKHESSYLLPVCLSPFLSLKLEVGATRSKSYACMHAWVIIICGAMIQHAHSLAHSMPPLYFPFSFETRTLDMQSCGAVIQHYTNACTLTTSLWILRLPVCSCIKLPAPLTHTHTLQVLE